MEFRAKIRVIGINPYVTVPAAVSRVLAGRGHVLVKGSVNRFPVKATLVPTGGGRHRLYVNGEMRKGARVGVGDTVVISLEKDNVTRAAPVPEALLKALEVDRQAKEAWDSLPPSHRKEYLDYLNWLKTPEALERNVEKVIAALRNKHYGK